jgi:hypothetical protein
MSLMSKIQGNIHTTDIFIKNAIEIWENDWKKFIRSIRTLQKIWKKYSK